jgi:Na+-driven multidrug efflux pump
MKETCAILPLVLIHTVIGGSAMVGRSVLLAIGKVRPFTISVLFAGVANVIFGYCFVRFGHLGLNGIVLGTICAVTCRCAIWMPWYTLRALRSEEPADGPPLLEPISPDVLG